MNMRNLVGQNGGGMDRENKEGDILKVAQFGVNEKSGSRKQVERIPKLAFSCNQISDDLNCHQRTFFQ